jgi:hypothetical protein
MKSDSRTARAEASRRSAHALVAAAPMPRPLARPDASGRKKTSENRIPKRRSMHAHPWRTPKTKRPRVWRPEGVRVASGDRGDRSPSAGSVFLEEIFAWRTAFHPRARQRIAMQTRRHGNVGEVIRHENSTDDVADGGEGREHYARKIRNASEFLTIRNNSYSQPFCRANRYASMRLAAPNLPMASER